MRALGFESIRNIDTLQQERPEGKASSDPIVRVRDADARETTARVIGGYLTAHWYDPAFGIDSVELDGEGEECELSLQLQGRGARLTVVVGRSGREPCFTQTRLFSVWYQGRDIKPRQREMLERCLKQISDWEEVHETLNPGKGPADLLLDAVDNE